jgi:hypothetical protein
MGPNIGTKFVMASYKILKRTQAELAQSQTVHGQFWFRSVGIFNLLFCAFLIYIFGSGKTNPT